MPLLVLSLMLTVFYALLPNLPVILSVEGFAVSYYWATTGEAENPGSKIIKLK